jgi:aspartate racemase
MSNDYPESVKKIIEFVKEKKLWYCITKNHEAMGKNLSGMGCAGAAKNRNRLGKTGIPVCDELKSNIGYYISGTDKVYILIHCRGNQELDLQKVKKVLGYEFIHLQNLGSTFNCEFGLVNPFFFGEFFPEIKQLFDKSLIEDFFPPYTVMTNAGDKNWGIEINVKELIKILKITQINDIITEDSKIIIKKHKIGILTGNGPESGIFLWQKINENIRNEFDKEFLGDLSFPPVFVESLPEMGLSMELSIRESETWKVVEDGISTLCKNGATIIGIACNTTQFFSKQIKKICENYHAEFISMTDAVDSYLTKNKINNFDFLGIKFVTDFNKWSDYRRLQTRYNIEIPSTIELDDINKLAFEVKMNVITPKGINELRRLINRYTKTDKILIALTELSLLLATQKQTQKSNKQFIDTLSILAQAISDRYLEDSSKILLKRQKTQTDISEQN